jgi:hypothetical protein
MMTTRARRDSSRAHPPDAGRLEQVEWGHAYCQAGSQPDWPGPDCAAVEEGVKRCWSAQATRICG